MSNTTIARWRNKAKKEARKIVAEKYGISASEVQEVVAMSKEYYQDKVRSINISMDLSTGINRVQTPMFGGYVAVSKAQMFMNLYEHGRISDEQWMRIMNGPMKDSIVRQQNKIINYNKAKDERSK
tara:strand:+ start:5527 stop:5904 length:378 start_codon:yes stop_codon:yes gene_type:complete